MRNSEIERLLKAFNERIDSLETKVKELFNKKSEDSLSAGQCYFRVGEWAYHIATRRPFRIAEIKEIFLRSEETSINYEIANCRTAEKSEVENHLKGKCDEKYVGKLVKGLDGRMEKITSHYAYHVNSDEFYFYKDGNDALLLYRQGKWAEALPDYHRYKYPKSKDELRFIIKEFFKMNDIANRELNAKIDEFLLLFE